MDNNLFLGETDSGRQLHSPLIYLHPGYSLESYCDSPVPQDERENRAYILAKHANYFNPPQYKYSDHVFADIKEATGLDFVAGSGEKATALPDGGITNLGQLKLPDFRRELGKSKALV